jgi:hypothetical protein
VSYPLHHDWMSEIKRMLQNSHLVNLHQVAKLGRNHSLTELQKRLNFARKYCSSLGTSTSEFQMPIVGPEESFNVWS